MEFLKWCLSGVATLVGLSLIFGAIVVVAVFGTAFGAILCVVLVVCLVMGGIKEYLDDRLANWHRKRQAR